MADSYSILDGRNVLVADSDETVVTLVADGLRDSGALVTEALGGLAAIGALKRADYDLLLPTLIMPEVGGWAVLNYLKAHKPLLLMRTILMVGYPYHAETITKLRNFSIPVIFKPFDLDDLRDVACDKLFQVELSQARKAA